MRYPSLFKPFKVGDRFIPNRIVMAAMGNNLAGPEGTPSPRTMAYYLENAKGGVGLITTKAVAVGLTGKHRARARCLFDPAHEQGMKRFVEAIYLGFQVIHEMLNTVSRSQPS